MRKPLSIPFTIFFVQVRIRLSERHCMDRVILHSDANCFYASVEMLLDPSLRSGPLAVCGSVEDRHGIILAKNEAAKRAGIKTGQTWREALNVCPSCVCVPPNYDQYMRFSKLLKGIYSRFSRDIEPFGMDECWLDVTDLVWKYPSPAALADTIRRTVREELGLTVSIGVSFNKILAKLGSDMKKPDAVTVLDTSCWRERVWPLPVSELLYCGPATAKRLFRRGVYTIGDLAALPVEYPVRWLGKNGSALWAFANGLDMSPVMPDGYEVPVKSVGHGITCTRDLDSRYDVWRVILELSQDVGHRLRLYDLSATGVRLYVRGSDLSGNMYQTPVVLPTQSPLDIARAAQKLFDGRDHQDTAVRAVTVAAIDLIPAQRPVQSDMFGAVAHAVKRSQVDACVDRIRGRFGTRSIISASLLGDMPMPDDGREIVRMPGLMYSD